MSDSKESGEPARKRGLLNPNVRRGAAATFAIRAIRTTQRLAWLAFEVVAAAIIVFEEWGWQPLAAGLARLARLEGQVRMLPPWPALAVFLVPSLLFLPLKLLSFWLIAGGHVIWAGVLFALAKVGGTALFARIFQLTQPALMRLAWFASAYNWFMPWKEAILARARETAVWKAGKAAGAHVRMLARDAWRGLRPFALELLDRLRQLVRR
jgi:hypothetical protein